MRVTESEMKTRAEVPSFICVRTGGRRYLPYLTYLRFDRPEMRCFGLIANPGEFGLTANL